MDLTFFPDFRITYLNCKPGNELASTTDRYFLKRKMSPEPKRLSHSGEGTAAISL